MASNKITKFRLANNQIYNVNDSSAVHFDNSQNLTEEQKQQVRENIGVVLPDWNQNDNTKPDYIKNRPFYESISLTTFLEEQQIDFSSSFTIPNPIVQGKTYFVHWDDAEYTIEATGKDIFGDGSIWIPYLEQADGLFTIEGTVMDAADKGIHNVAIYTTELSLKTIDEKFIPDTIARKDDFVVRSVSGHLPDSNGNVNVGYYDVIDRPPIKRGSGQESIMQLGATEASGGGSHAEGSLTTSSGMYSHAEGASTEASGEGSHAEGQYTKSIGTYSHSEGVSTRAGGLGSHAEGSSCSSTGRFSHAEGYGTIASSDYQHVEGQFNIEDSAGNYAHIIGNGDSHTNSNAHTLDWSGNAWYAGKVSIGTTSNVPTPTDANDLVTKQYVDNKFSTKTTSVTLAADSWTTSGNKFKYTYSNTSLRASASPIITCTSNEKEYSYIADAEATANTGIVFTANKKPTSNIILTIIDIG